jgi:phage FluMu gp28-like protein
LERGVAKVAERRAGSDGKGRHGDSAIAAALAYFASRVEAGEVGYQAVAVEQGRFARGGRGF